MLVKDAWKEADEGFLFEYESRGADSYQSSTMLETQKPFRQRMQIRCP